jgi:Phospholipase_D-nuclease N-terminal
VKPVFLVTIVGLVLGASWDGLCLWDLARADQVRYLPKWAWAMVCLISCPLGGLLYVIVGRDAFRRAR